jgi:hypothetical protein
MCGMLLAPTTGTTPGCTPTTPLVQVDRAAPGLDADVVGIDDAAAAADAVDHLVAHGHRRIGYISDHPLVPTSRARLAGYRRAMAAHALDVRRTAGSRAECPDAASAAAATRELLAGNELRSTDGALSAATRCSLGVVPTLHAIGRTDVALVCFGDFAMADLLQPSVTVVDHSAEAVGAAAATRLAERIAQPDLPASIIHVPVRLIPRGSGEIATVTAHEPRAQCASTSAPTMSKALCARPSGEQLALVEARTPWTTTQEGGTETSAECFVELAVDLLRRGTSEPRRAVAVAGVGSRRRGAGRERGAARRLGPAAGLPWSRGSTAAARADRLNLTAQQQLRARIRRRTGLPWDCQSSVAKLLWFVDGGLQLAPAHRWLSVPEYVGIGLAAS